MPLVPFHPCRPGVGPAPREGPPPGQPHDAKPFPMSKTITPRDSAVTHVLLSTGDLAILKRELGPRHALTRRVREALADLDDPMFTRYRRAAMRETRSGELEIDPGAVVSKGAGAGAYVMAWLWINDEEAGIPEEHEPSPHQAIQAPKPKQHPASPAEHD